MILHTRACHKNRNPEGYQTVKLPTYFCWTRFGTEAGQAIDQILWRKEQERAANGGLFFWGIGNALGPSIEELLRKTTNPEVLFSPIKSVPRSVDSQPAGVVAWTAAETLRGEPFSLPEQTLVTSRYDPNAPRASSYALVCFSTVPLNQASFEEQQIAPATLRNLRTGRPIGASQVTAIVESVDAITEKSPTYGVMIRAKLVEPYFLRLRNPLALPKPDKTADWEKAVREVWSHRLAGFGREPAATNQRVLS
jgi:hypothetical protein